MPHQSLIEFYDHLKDPVSTYFMERIQILLSSKGAIEVLQRSEPAPPRQEWESRDARLSISTQKELRAKKMDFNFKVNAADELERRKSINELMDKTKKMHESVNNHIRKEISTQEDEFNRKMNQRRERSVNRSMNKTMERRGNYGEELERDSVAATGKLLEGLKVAPNAPNAPKQAAPARKLENPFFQDDF